MPTASDQLSACVAQYVNQGNPSQEVRDARADRLAKFLTNPGSHIPAKYVIWWLAAAFLLGFFFGGGFQH
jgi:hypothetical protein